MVTVIHTNIIIIMNIIVIVIIVIVVMITCVLGSIPSGISLRSLVNHCQPTCHIGLSLTNCLTV
jgi:hypothetical protein